MLCFRTKKQFLKTVNKRDLSVQNLLTFLCIGGACGYEDAVEKAPFSAKVSAGGPSLFQSGKGCGACYQVNAATCSNSIINISFNSNHVILINSIYIFLFLFSGEMHRKCSMFRVAGDGDTNGRVPRLCVGVYSF